MIPQIQVEAIGGTGREGGTSTGFRMAKEPTDIKIKSFVLHQIVRSLPTKIGALFPAEAAPRAVLRVLAALYGSFLGERKREVMSRKRRSSHLSKTYALGICSSLPVGLTRCDGCPWWNSLLQFFLFLPGTKDLCSLIPHSFQGFQEFIDQYFFDQEEGKPVSLVDSAELLRYLMRKLPMKLFQNRQAIYENLIALIRSFFPECPFSQEKGMHPVILHPEWHLVLHGNSLNGSFQEKLKQNPAEFLIGFSSGHLPFKTHCFAAFESAFYDLDAFIEQRLDRDGREYFIAYLKLDSKWYQCDDDRIVLFRSHCLNAPLQNAVLLHYRRHEWGRGIRF
ncbi:MAG: hypothetical protein FJZ64_00570 [Chlamydiae bacterium]|nr:hypothetical protein [Chlamydiota bacterium]